MVSKRYLTIDTSVEPSLSHDFTLYLKKETSPDHRKIFLKSVYVQHENDATKIFAFTVNGNTTYMPLCIHCSMLSKDDNFVNDRMSDLLGIIYPTESRVGNKLMYIKFNNGSGKLISPSNCIRLYLTNFKGEPVEHTSKYYIIYELEFF